MVKVGERVIMCGNSPHAGRSGVVVSFDALSMCPWLGKRPRIRLDNGLECFATRDDHYVRAPK